MKRITKYEVIKKLSEMIGFLTRHVSWDEWSKNDKELYQSIKKYIEEEAEKNENL